MRTDTYYTPEGSRWRSTWVYDGLSRARRRNDFTWYPGNPGGWYNSGETRFLYDGRRVIQERNSGNTPTVTYTRGPDLSGSFEGAGGIGRLLARSHGYSGSTGAWSTEIVSEIVVGPQELIEREQNASSCGLQEGAWA